MPFTEADAFCTEDDVEAKCGRSFNTTTSRPSEQQVIDFMGQRAAEVQAVLFANGYGYTPATIPAGTNQEKVVKQLASNANAWLAAGDALLSWAVTDDTEPTEEAKAAWEQGKTLLEQLAAAIGALAVTTASGSARSSTTSGGVAAADFTEKPFDAQRARSSGFSLDQKW